MSDNAKDEECAETLDRMEELAKLQERRQQRLTQLRELRSRKPVTSWSTDLSQHDAKLKSPLSSGPKLRKKNSSRSSLSKSLPPNVTPPFVNQSNLLKKTHSASARVESRGRTAVQGDPMKREESPHPARLLTRMKSVDAPGDHADFSKQLSLKMRPSSAQMQRQPSSSRQSSSNVRANPISSTRLTKSSSQLTSAPNSYESKASCGISHNLDAPVNSSRPRRQNSNSARTNHSSDEKSHPESTSDRSSCMSSIPTVQEPTSLKKLLDNSGDVDYTQSAEELRQLIIAMQVEFKTLRDSKAQAEATADKLRTEFSLHQVETEAQLFSLSDENERLRSNEIKLQVELNQGNEKLNKAEKEKCALRSRLLKSQNDKLSAETKVTILEVENAALHKALNDMAKSKGYGSPIPDELIEDIEISGYARSA
jgi:hypothetical protein